MRTSLISLTTLAALEALEDTRVARPALAIYEVPLVEISDRLSHAITYYISIKVDNVLATSIQKLKVNM
jgi:hypothetical protein